MQSLFPGSTGGGGYSISTPSFQVPSSFLHQAANAQPMLGSQQLVRVNGIESAKAYPTQPNSMYALFDENEDFLYIKSTDASNFPTIRKFKLIEEKEKEVEQPRYVTVEEFNKFKEELLNGKQYIQHDKSSKYNGKQRNPNSERNWSNQNDNGYAEKQQ